MAKAIIRLFDRSQLNTADENIRWTIRIRWGQEQRKAAKRGHGRRLTAKGVMQLCHDRLKLIKISHPGIWWVVGSYSFHPKEMLWHCFILSSVQVQIESIIGLYTWRIRSAEPHLDVVWLTKLVVASVPNITQMGYRYLFLANIKYRLLFKFRASKQEGWRRCLFCAMKVHSAH